MAYPIPMDSASWANHEATGAVVGSPPLELVPDKLYRLGAVARVLGDDIAWLPANRRGWEALNVYLLRGTERWVLLDTGVAAQGSLLADQLHAITPLGSALTVMLTRSEPDCIGNLGPILDGWSVDAVYAGGGPNSINPFDYFDQVTQDIGKTGGARLVRQDYGDGVGLTAKCTAFYLRPPLRLLATSWVFDEGTGTLFTSDFFGYMGLERAGDKPISRDVPDAATVTAIEEWIPVRFDWVRNADLTQVIHNLQEVFRSHRVQRIAPTHGCIIEGTSCVAAHVQSVVDTLARLSLRVA